MTVTIQSTKITEVAEGFGVEMVLSSEPDVDSSADVVHIWVMLEMKERTPRLAELQKTALQHVRNQLDGELRRLQSLLGRSA
jgi:hypothetical protein